MAEAMELRLGGESLVISNVKLATQFDVSDLPDNVRQCAEEMCDAVITDRTSQHGKTTAGVKADIPQWPTPLLLGMDSKERSRTIICFSREIQPMLESAGLPLISELEWGGLVNRHARLAPRRLQQELLHTLWVKVAAFGLQLASFVAVGYGIDDPLPLGSTVRPAAKISVMHQIYEHCERYQDRRNVLLRSYEAVVDRKAGEAKLGPQSKFAKVFSFTPGLNTVDIAASRELRRLLRFREESAVSPKELAAARKKVSFFRHNLENKRRSMGIGSTQFNRVDGKVIDMDNPDQLRVGLPMFKALVAAAVAKRERQYLARVAQRHDVTVENLTSNPAIAQVEAETVTRHVNLLRAAEMLYREGGHFVMPKPYVRFASGQAPASLQRFEAGMVGKESNLALHELPGTSGAAWPLLGARTRLDREVLLSSPAVLGFCYDHTEVIRACGTPVYITRGAKDVVHKDVVPQYGVNFIPVMVRGTDKVVYGEAGKDSDVVDLATFDELCVTAQAADKLRGDGKSTACQALHADWIKGVQFKTSDGMTQSITEADQDECIRTRLLPLIIDFTGSNKSRPCEYDLVGAEQGMSFDMTPQKKAAWVQQKKAA